MTTYQGRLDANWKSLLADVDRWRKSLPAGTDISHHVGQFRIFSERAHECLMNAYRTALKREAFLEHGDDQVLFESVVNGALIAQWMILRQVAGQRQKGSPYLNGLATLDKRAASLFYRLREGLPAKACTSLSVARPLVYLGRLSDLQLFDSEPLAVIGVPFGALDDDVSAHAIGHELGHIICDRLSGLLPEIEQAVWERLRANRPTQPQQTLHEVIMSWLEEIVADLVGTALEGRAFAESARVIHITPDALIDANDGKHPMPVIRPYIHLQALKLLKKDVADLSYSLEDATRKHLRRRFQSVSPVTVASLGTVRDEMIKIVDYILQATPSALDKSVGQFLIDCDAAQGDTAPEKLEQWGDLPPEECEHFVLKLPDKPEFDGPIDDFLCLIDAKYCQKRSG